MLEFIKKNKQSLFIVVFVTLFIYIVRITQYSFSIDTEIMINDPNGLLKSWFAIGRYGLCFFKLLFNTTNINVICTSIVAVIFLISNSVLWLFLLEKTMKIEFKNTIIKILTMLLITSSPVLCEQIGFTLQAVEIMIGLNIMAIANIASIKWVEQNKLIYLLCSIILLLITFSFYQAFVFLYMTSVVFYLIVKSNSYIENYKSFFIDLAKYVLVFIISFALYMVINNYVLSFLDIQKGTYLTNQIKWGNETFIINVKNIGISVLKTIIGYENVWHPFYFILFLIFFYTYCFNSLNNRKILILKLFLSLCLFIIPFSLIILTASQTAGRAQFSIVYSIAFLSLWIGNNYVNNKKITILLTILVILQCSTTFILNYSAYVCFSKEQALVEDISKKIIENDYENKTIAIVGEYNPNSYFKGETLGHSFFEWDYFGGLVTNARIQGFVHALGYDYKFVDNELAELTELVKNEKTWFDEKKLYLINDIVVIKLS